MDSTKKNKFNIVDTFVVLILLALIFGIIFFTLRESRSLYAERNEKNISYTICISGVDEEYISIFESDYAENDINTKIFNSSTLNYLGTITNVSISPAKENGTQALPGASAGKYVLEQKEQPGVYDIYITLSSKAKLDTRGVAYIDSERITIGSELDIRCNDFAAQSHILSFSFN